MIYLPEIDNIYLGASGVTKIMQGDVRVWPVNTPGTGGTINSAITTDFVLGNPVMDVDDIVPYGLYVFIRAAQEDEFARLTIPYNQAYESERYNYTFTTASIENGIMPASDAQRVRIVRAIPVEDVQELDGAVIYIKDYPSPGDNVYTGSTYLLYDIYNEKYFGYNYLNSIVDFEDASEFAGSQDNQNKASVLCNAFSASNDGNKVGMRAPFSVSSNSFKPFAYTSDGGKVVLAGTPQLTNGNRPYNFNTDSRWDELKVDIVPVTAIE